MREIQFASNEIYHIYNRGVEKRKLFLKDNDYFRFIHDLFEFNDTAPAGRFPTFGDLASEINKSRKRELLVEILCFCLMPNHFHLLLRQIRDKGITNFMQKLGTGYTMYFNGRYERVGALFQAPFKAVLINKETHFYHLPYYIHVNPLELIIPKWEKQGIKDYKKTNQFLNSYRWSSHLDYIDKKNFPSVISSKFLSKIWGGSQRYKLDFKKWLKDINIDEIREEIIEE